MRALALTFAIAIGAAAASPAAAQEPSREGPARLSVEQAVERALAANDQARIARAGVDRTQGLVRQALSAALPSVDATYQLTRNLQQPILFFNQDGETSQVRIGNANEHLFGVTVEQTVFDRSLGAGVRAAKHGNAASEANYDRALSDVALETRRAYYDALLARSQVEVAENAVRIAEARSRQVELFNQVGTASEFDLLTARVNLENARPRAIQARNQRRLAENELKRVIGEPLDEDLVLTDSLAYAPVDVTLDEATARALASRSDLEAQQQTVALNEELVNVERADGYPTLSLRLNVQRRSTSDQFIPQDRDFSQSASAALALSVPVFDGRETEGRTLQARADYVASLERLKGLEQDVRLDVLDAWQTAQAAAEAVEATRATVEQAQKAYDIATVRFKNGLSTQLELQDAEQGLTQARSNAAQALYDHMLARARLRHAMGGW